MTPQPPLTDALDIAVQPTDVTEQSPSPKKKGRPLGRKNSTKVITKMILKKEKKP
jgi:hypothetical protein